MAVREWAATRLVGGFGEGGEVEGEPVGRGRAARGGDGGGAELAAERGAELAGGSEDEDAVGHEAIVPESAGMVVGRE